MKPEETYRIHQLLDDDVSTSAAPGKLSLEDTISQTMRGLKVPHSRYGAGYNPYETIPNTSSTGSFARHKDLRELSRWISLKRQVQSNKN